MDGCNKFPNRTKQNLIQQENNKDEKTANVKESSYTHFKPNTNLPPPLPGVFVFDRPNHQRILPLIDPNFDNSLNPLASTTIDSFSDNGSYGKTRINGSSVHELHGNQHDFQSQSLTMYNYSLHSDQKELKPIQPTLPSVDSMLPSESNVYQSLQPVSQDLFGVLPHTEPKVYQQLQTVTHSAYRMETENPSEQKIYQQLTPVSVGGNIFQNGESRIYHQLNPVNRTHRDPKSFSQLQSLDPTYEPPDYINSKLYQQLRKPPKKVMEPQYQTEVKTYHQLRPVTVNDFESQQNSNFNQANQYSYPNHSDRDNRLNCSNRYHQLKSVCQTNHTKSSQNIKNINLISPPPNTLVNDRINRKSPLDLQRKGTVKNHEQVSFQTNKPKIYLELRNPSVRHQMEISSGNHHRSAPANDSHYYAAMPNYEASYQEVRPSLHTPLPVTTGNKPKNNDIKLPSPYEFNLPQSNALNKYRLPKILGPNEYNSPQQIVTAESVESNQINQNFCSPNNSIASTTTKPSYINNFTELTPTKQPNVPLSLPKVPVCYGDLGINNRYREMNSFIHEEKTILSDNGKVINNSTNSSTVPVQQSISSNISYTTINSMPVNTIPENNKISSSSVINHSSKNKIDHKNSKFSNNNFTFSKLGSVKLDSSPKAINLSCNSGIKEETSKESLELNNENNHIVTVMCTQSSDKVIGEQVIVKVKESIRNTEQHSVLNLANIESSTNTGQVVEVRKEANSEKSSVELKFDNQNASCVSSPDKICEQQYKYVTEFKPRGSNELSSVPNSKCENEFNTTLEIKNSAKIALCENLKPLSNDSQKSIITKYTNIRSAHNGKLPKDNWLQTEHCAELGLSSSAEKIKPECIVSAQEEKSLLDNMAATEMAVDYSLKVESRIETPFQCKVSIKLNEEHDSPIHQAKVRKGGFKRKTKASEPIKNESKKRKYTKTKGANTFKFNELNHITSYKATVTNNDEKTIIDGFKGFDESDIVMKHYGKIKLSIVSIESVIITKSLEQNNQNIAPLNDNDLVRKKRKYTRRKPIEILVPRVTHESKTEKISIKKHTPRKKIDLNQRKSSEDKYKESPCSVSLNKGEEKYELIDPLEEGLISDDGEEDLVFLGFDVPTDDDDTLLGFDVEPIKKSNLDSISSLLSELEVASVTVECDPRSLLEAPPDTTACSQCSKTFDNHLKLVEHMQWHAAIQSPHTHSYVCSVCFRGFATSEKLARHIRWTHEGGKKFSCSVCSKRFTTSHYVKRHVETVHSQRQSKKARRATYFCSECPLTFTSEALLNCHIDKVHKKSLHQCDKCLKYFVKYANLQRHKQYHLNENKAFTCAYCNRAFSSRKLLHKHWPVHSDKQIFKCEICDSKFTAINSLKRHKMLHSEEKLFRCEICQKSFSLLSTLKTHLLIHTGARRFECKLCGKKFNRRDVLNAHQWIHTGEKRFQCDICSEKFRWRHAVKSHKLIYHTTEKPHVCEICGKRFSHPDSFKKHAEVHSEKVYYCQICLKSFSRPSTLKSHILTHTDLKPFFCDVCNKAFRSKSHLRNHFLVHTKEKPWLCKFCNKTYKDHIQLRRHKRIVHCKAFYKKVLPAFPKNLQALKTEVGTADENAVLTNQEFPMDQGTSYSENDVSKPSEHFQNPQQDFLPKVEESV